MRRAVTGRPAASRAPLIAPAARCPPFSARPRHTHRRADRVALRPARCSRAGGSRRLSGTRPTTRTGGGAPRRCHTMHAKTGGPPSQASNRCASSRWSASLAWRVVAEAHAQLVALCRRRARATASVKSAAEAAKNGDHTVAQVWRVPRGLPPQPAAPAAAPAGKAKSACRGAWSDPSRSPPRPSPIPCPSLPPLPSARRSAAAAYSSCRARSEPPRSPRQRARISRSCRGACASSSRCTASCSSVGHISRACAGHHATR